MKIIEEMQGDVVVLRMSGKIMGGPDSEIYQKQVKELVAEGKKNIVVDMSQVSWVNSTGLGILIAGYSTVKNAGGALKLVGVNKRIEQIFVVTKLHTIFETFDEEASALASF